MNAQPSGTDEVVVRAMRSLGFQALYSEARAEGTFLGLPAVDAGRLLFVSGTGLDEAERDALLLVLLFRSRGNPEAHDRLQSTLLHRVDLITDWSLLAEILSPPVPDSADDSLLRLVHLETARRIALALEASIGGGDRSVAGYERAAIALADSARGLASVPRATSLASDVVLAETFREIGRLSRSPNVVKSLNLAARELLR